MSPDELATTDAWLNGILRPVVQVLGWAIAIFAVCYFAYKGWVWLGLPNLLDYLPHRHYVQPEENDLPAEAVQDRAFANAADDGSTAFTRDGTERTPEAEAEPGVQIQRLSPADLQHIITALENRGYLCLTPEEQEAVRKIVYQTERQARFRIDRSKSGAIENGLSIRRGGSRAYQRASKLYDALVGQPPPAVEKRDIPQQEAVNA